MKTAKYIADRIRLFIATRQFQVDELLPSTRELGKQLEVSFHTVRKAYSILEQEGLVRAEKGRGFLITKQVNPISKEERLELGAEKMRTLLEELISYGLSEEEVESLFDEQLSYLDWPERLQSCASVGITTEHARMISGAIKEQVGVNSEAITIHDYDSAVNYDALFVPVAHYSSFYKDHSDTIVIPIVYAINAQTLIQISTHLAVRSIGLVCKEDQTIAQIVQELKTGLGFKGSIIAGTVYGKSLPLFVREVDLVLYLTDSSSLVEKQLPEKRRLQIRYTISETSTSLIRAELWDQ